MLQDIHFDPLSAGFAADPHPIYDQLRALPEPYYYADIDTYMLTKMEDVEAVALNPTMVRSRDHLISAEEQAADQRAMNWHDMPHHERFVQTNLLESEGDTHDRLRKLVFKTFTPVMVARQRQMIEDFVDSLIDELRDRESFDFIADFAAHIPGHIIGKVLGVPDEDCPQLRYWSEEVVRFFNVGCDDDDKARAETATRDFYFYLKDLIIHRRESPQDDLLTVLMQHYDAGRMSEDELIATAMLILMAGHGSTIDVLGSGMHALIRFPDEYKRLRGDPSLIRTGVQEMFRFESPLPYFHRFATEDTEVGGKLFPAGTRFGLLYGAANRDPSRFEAPERFDIGRTPNRHRAFGAGSHFCLGNHLARLDMDVIFTKLNAEFGELALMDEIVEYKRGLSVRGPIALHLCPG